MEKRRLKFVIPTMVIVAIVGIYMLNNYYQDVPTDHRPLIIISTTLLSGILAYKLFPHDDESPIDPKPAIMNRKTSK
ncbi:hypothetical protein SAMN05880501_11362 [Ureibacillus xyleni]|uniref:Uncharacterized protein n=1 Tax=Ureibacillus xyleni TaxID=614648 RepID=A0A285THP3_9BACL|nr:hypothetical protein [Ureibacillus xyleni]SOC21788.1 hypothetical protein SAMN05880501_11362 [Ureibacillus xyleni]